MWRSIIIFLFLFQSTAWALLSINKVEREALKVVNLIKLQKKSNLKINEVQKFSNYLNKLNTNNGTVESLYQLNLLQALDILIENGFSKKNCIKSKEDIQRSFRLISYEAEDTPRYLLPAIKFLETACPAGLLQ